MPRVRFRELAVVAAGLLIATACTWRILTPRTRPAVTMPVADQRPAPAFQLHDQQSRLVNLEAYLHRHRIVLVFFDGVVDPETHPPLKLLREYYPALEQQGIIVLGVSNALPQTLRAQLSRPFPFPLLSDVQAGQPGSACVQWGTVQAAASTPGNLPSDQPALSIQPAVFLIERSGLVDWENNYPRPVSDPSQLIRTLLTGG